MSRWCRLDDALTRLRHHAPTRIRDEHERARPGSRGWDHHESYFGDPEADILAIVARRGSLEEPLAWLESTNVDLSTQARIVDGLLSFLGSDTPPRTAARLYRGLGVFCTRSSRLPHAPKPRIVAVLS
jgi:hypothetical protein